jgi:shikimate O-hydroxycinnamoyltransferase
VRPSTTKTRPPPSSPSSGGTSNGGATTSVVAECSPSSAAPCACVPLSSSDLVVPNVHVEVVYAFAAPCPHAHVLRDSLATVLDEYREWAGRLGHDETGRPAIVLNDEGASFVEAEADGPMQDVYPFNPSPLLLDMLPPNRGVEELLLIQVTFYTCGGTTLGVARHHQVADGEAASNFMDAWAAVCKGIPLTPVLHDWSALMPREPPNPTFDHIEYRKPTPKPDSGEAPVHPPLVRKKLHFDVEMLKRIKSHAVKADDDRGFYTTFESLTGHLWKCVTQARGLTGEMETRIMVAANARRRLSHPVGENYLGNVIFHACARTMIQQLIEEPLSSAAGLIHTAIRSLDNEYLRSAIDFVEVQRKTPVARSRSTVMSPNLSITSWVQLPLYKLNFGWGTPVYAGPPWVPFEGLVILIPSSTQDGSIDAIIGLFEPDMAKLEEICYQAS